MKKKLLWVLLVLAVIVIVALAVLLPKADGKGNPEEPAQAAAESAQTAAEPAQTAAEPAEENSAEPTVEQESSIVMAEGELPLDTTTSKPVTESSGAPDSEPAESSEIQPYTDPETGLELEDDELPIIEP